MNISKKIIAIGDINIDLALQGIKDLMNIKLGTEIELTEYAFEVGGSAFNFIKAMNSFGMEVDLYGKIGNDFLGNYIKDYLDKHKIDNSLIISKNIKTGITTVIPINDNRFFLTYNGGNEYLCFNDLDLEKIMRFNHLHLSSYYLLKSLQQDLLKLVKAIKSNKNITISFDPGYDPADKWQNNKIFKILKYIDIFLPNEIEALKLTKSKNIESAINLLSEYCPIVVIKLGPRGSAAKNNRIFKSEIIYSPPFNVEVVDTSCCGDCFDAGFIYGFLNGYSFEDSLDLANGCGSLQANKLGSYRFKGIEEIIDFIKVSQKVQR